MLNESAQTTPSIRYSNCFSATFTLILLALPFWICLFFCCKKSHLTEPLYMAKYGTIYAELDLDKQWSLLFNVMFVIRRFLFALSTILMGQWVTFQLQV